MNDLRSTKSEDVGLIVRAISFQDFINVVMIHQRHRRTDGRTTCDIKTALCTVVHRAVKSSTTTSCKRRTVHVLPASLCSSVWRSSIRDNQVENFIRLQSTCIASIKIHLTNIMQDSHSTTPQIPTLFQNPKLLSRRFVQVGDILKRKPVAVITADEQSA